ncbi:hypothetical protein ACHAQJ_007381 [Trichoderma viride]
MIRQPMLRREDLYGLGVSGDHHLSYIQHQAKEIVVEEDNVGFEESINSRAPDPAPRERINPRASNKDNLVLESPPNLWPSKNPSGPWLVWRPLILAHLDVHFIIGRPQLRRSDPWSIFSLRYQTPSEYKAHIQTFKSLFRSFDACFIAPAGTRKITALQSLKRHSGYVSTPKYDLRHHNTPSEIGSVDATPALDARDIMDAPPTYSDQSPVDAGKSQEYLLEFTNHLYTQLRSRLTIESIEKATNSLPDLLTTFALKMGEMSQSQTSRDVMHFVYKHRELITQSLKILNESDQIAIQNRSILATDKINLLWNKARSLGPEKVLDPFHDADEEKFLLEDVSHYREAITKNPAFEWLIEKLSSEIHQTEVDLHAMRNISRRILKGLLSAQRFIRWYPSKPFKVTFDIDCDILGFVEGQGYDEPAAEVIPKVITLTGSITDVQATTCEEYIRQTWPETGCHVLQTVQSALRVYDPTKPLRSSVKCKLADQTEIKVSIGEKLMRVETMGTAHSIAEIGEQIAWLSTTLTSSAQESMIPFRYPEIPMLEDELYSDSHYMQDKFEKAFACKINVATDTKQSKRNLPNVNGQCWQYMFNNPVVVTGYPIKPRADLEPGAGLELPFDMMTTLADARYLTTFEDKTVVKGFSTMLIPTRAHNNIVSWHLLVDESGERISYRDPRVRQGITIEPASLRSARHILGWCPKAQNNIGSPNANYDIKWSGLGQPKQRIVLEGPKFSIGVGNYIRAHFGFKRGKKDRSVCIFMKGSYKSLVDHIGKHHILLYDVTERRGWLSDGHSALLHLIRASLRRDQQNYPDGHHMNRTKLLNEAPPSNHGARAARIVLEDSDNSNTILYIDTIDIRDEEVRKIIDGKTIREKIETENRKYYRLRNKVEEIALLLEVAIDQTNKSVDEGALRGTSRKILNGFDFMDVATLRPLIPHTVNLQIAESSSGWPDLVRSVQAVTLFGKDFGELIKPIVDSSIQTCNHCGYEATLPSGKDHLAVSVEVLGEILEINGGKDTIPWRLGDDLYWHCPRAAFEPCQCAISHTRGSKHDRVQKLFRKKPSGCSTSASPMDLEGNGAVIFGHGQRLPFWTIRSTKAVKTISSSADNAQLQVTIQPLVVTIPSVQIEGSSQTSEEQLLSDDSSTTPDTSLLSETVASNLNNDPLSHQRSPLDVHSTQNTAAIGPPQNLKTVLSTSFLGVSLRRIRNICVSGFKKVKGH